MSRVRSLRQGTAPSVATPTAYDLLTVDPGEDESEEEVEPEPAPAPEPEPVKYVPSATTFDIVY